MSSQIIFCLMCLLVIFFHETISAPISSKDLDNFEQKRNLADLFDRYRNDLNQRLANHRYYDDDDTDQATALYGKRQMPKKRMKAFHYPHAGYTIAFPALIRSRRWIDQQDEYDQ